MSAFTDVASVYETLGSDDPFYAMLSYDRYRKEKLDKAEFYATGHQQIASVFDTAQRLGLDIRSRRALDFGCGVGRLTNALAVYFEEVVGLDISHSMVKNATAHCDAAKCRFVVNKEPDLRVFDDAEFDFVYSDKTIQHIPKPASEHYIGELMRVLKPGGTAVFLVPDGPLHRDGSLSARIDTLYREKLRPWFKRVRGKHPVQMHSIARERIESLIAGAGCGLLQTEIPPKFRDSNRQYLPLFYWVEK